MEKNADDLSYKIALCQMMVTADKQENLRRAAAFTGRAASLGAEFVCLPEIWNSPYDMTKLGAYAELAGGPSTELMSGLAARHGIYLIGGSIPEAADGRVYNASFVFDPAGNIIAKHRKAHLYDVNIEKGIRFRESDFFAAGSGTTVFDTKFGKMGLAVCFDVRFPDMFREMAKAGAHLVFLPAAFNMTTGPAHWDTLMKSRALDNQFYLAACAPARNPAASYTSWGHSCVATPWGEYCAAADARENILCAEIDIKYIEQVRRELPLISASLGN